MARSRRRRKEAKPEQNRAIQSGSADDAQAEMLKTLQMGRNEKIFNFAMIVAVFLFGIYLSNLYYGQREVPNSDFPAFLSTAEPLLSLELPTNFKRLPGLGLLHIAVSNFISEPYSELKAGWLLNGMLYPLNLVLLFLIAKHFIDKWALGFTLLVAINPWAIGVYIQPLVEVTLMFCTLSTFCLIIRRSKWAYLAAMAASVIRYDGAVLIFVAFVIDMVESKDIRQRLKCLIPAILASIPVGLWILATIMHKKAAAAAGGSGGPSYITQFGHSTAVKEFLYELWRVTLSPLFATRSDAGVNITTVITKIIAPICFVAGAGYGLYKKNWNMLALLLFFVPYFLSQSMKAATRGRYAYPMAWIVLLVFCFGFKFLGGLIRNKLKIPQSVIWSMQVFVILWSLVWLMSIGPLVSDPLFELDGGLSAKIPYIIALIVIAVTVIRGALHQWKFILPDSVLTVMVCLMVVSNQFVLKKMLGDGKKDIEFKYLAEWYRDNAEPDDVLITTLPNLVSIFQPENIRNFYATEKVAGDDWDSFVESCRRREKRIEDKFGKDITTYVAWDSRLGYATTNSYYNKYRLKRIVYLKTPTTTFQSWPFEFHERITHSDRRFINIFRLSAETQRPPGLPVIRSKSAPQRSPD